eukprot:974846_1
MDHRLIHLIDAIVRSITIKIRRQRSNSNSNSAKVKGQIQQATAVLLGVPLMETIIQHRGVAFNMKKGTHIRQVLDIVFPKQNKTAARFQLGPSHTRSLVLKDSFIGYTCVDDTLSEMVKKGIYDKGVLVEDMIQAMQSVNGNSVNANSNNSENQNSNNSIPPPLQSIDQ